MVTRTEIEVTTAADAVMETIRSRRSIGRVGPERPSRELIETLLEAATWAPNHHLTEPWRFVVLAGEARAAFGQAMAEAVIGRPENAERTEAFDRAAAKALRAPVIIAVAIDPESGPKSVEIEEIAAGAAAVQNILLAAHAHGLASIWRTGAASLHAHVKAFFDLPPSAHLLGFVYLGYPLGPSPIRERTPHASVTRWHGWDE